MGDSSGLSRRNLFGFGLSRLLPDLDEDEGRPAPASVGAIDGARYAELQAEAWGKCEGLDLWEEASAVLLEATSCGHGDHLLDAGAGVGPLALLAAERGATVTACDAAAGLVERGRARSAAAGAQVDWHEADLAELPFADGTFDAALSAFAPMFCLEARRAFSELLRVVRPGGTVAVATWMRGGAVGSLLTLAIEHDPPPAGVPKPLNWGREERLRPELRCDRDDPAIEHASLTMRFGSRDEAAVRLVGALGPAVAAAEHAPGFEAKARALVDELAEDDGAGVRLESRYLVARAVRPGTR